MTFFKSKALALFIACAVLVSEARIASKNEGRRLEVSDYPHGRFIPYEFLQTAEKAAATTLDYTEETWNTFGGNPLEKKSQSSMTDVQKTAALVFDLDEDNWDCYVNHYGNYNWDELKNNDVAKYYVILGWSHLAWRGTDPEPETETMDWKDLSSEQKEAARNVCYFEELWDVTPLTTWDCPTNNFDSLDWDDLALEGVQQYVKAMGWTRDAWDGDDEAPLYNWNTMSDEQRTAASHLCYNKREWDDPPYPSVRYHPYKFLKEDQKASVDDLGFTQTNWNTPGTADIEDKAYDDLTSVQQVSIKSLDMTSEGWDCFINHYNGYDWEDLGAKLQQSFVVLGYNMATWYDDETTPTTHDLLWDKLSGAQKSAARDSCWFEETWDGLELELWDCGYSHFNSYSWDELKVEGVQQFFVTLGWDHDSWGGRTDRPSTDGMDWDEMTSTQRHAATNLCFLKSDWQGPSSAYPTIRYELWDSTTTEVKAAATTLGYTMATWNAPGTAVIEKTVFEDLDEDQEEAVGVLGMTDDVWDCYVNHYDSYTWDELEAFDYQDYFRTLGYTRNVWVAGSANPNSELGAVSNKDWEDLNSEEESAALSICYFKETWDETPLDSWDCSRNHYVTYSWGELEVEGVADYFTTLGWDATSWSGNEDGYPASEDMAWNELSKEQQTALRMICVSKEKWDTTGNPTASDCERNNYTTFNWYELVQADLSQYFITLGWNERSWADLEDYPESDNEDWDELTPKQQAAAKMICMNESKWMRAPTKRPLDITEKNPPGNLSGNPSGSSKGPNVGGIVAGVFVSIAAVGALAFVIWKLPKNGQSSNSDAAPEFVMNEEAEQI